MLKRAVLMLIGIFVIAAMAAAEIPNTINYQGRLTDVSGEPVPDGVYNIIFTIYDDPVLFGGGHDLWTSGTQPVTITNGLFNYILGSNVALPSDIADGSSLWLGIKVWLDPEISPRTELTSVPYAHHADFADNLVNVPGLAMNSSVGEYAVTPSMQDVLTVTITIPADGYIAITGKALGYHTGTSNGAVSLAQIDETFGGTYSSPYYTEWGDPISISPLRYDLIYVNRVYFKTAGTYTFRLEARYIASSTGAVHMIKDPSIIAAYYPASYGRLDTYVVTSEMGQFENIEYEERSFKNDTSTEESETAVKVDLRELELKSK